MNAGQAMTNAITKIEENSPLKGKVFPGEKLVSINGREICDVLDYKFFAYDARLSLVLKTPTGEHKEIVLKKPDGEDLGLEFETYLMDSARSCRNRCVFCFIDQLPRGMRKTLYFKDDDARLSFLTGNYITLTNLSERELQRIIDLRISPINISVHATEPGLRAKMLGNDDGARGFEIMQKLAAGGIKMNCQIVCCPGLNDGEALSQSMRELSSLYPQVGSVSIVPVGLTKYRDRLFPLTPFDRESAIETVDRIEAFSEKCFVENASRMFYPSDEFFIKAGRDIPPDEYYEEYAQLENGVGMMRLLEEEFASELRFGDLVCDGVQFSIATGVSAAPFLTKLLVTARKKHANIKGEVFPIVNDFFGHMINVAGLITGSDLIVQLRDKSLGERLLIPQSMLRDGEEVFLDDVSLSDVRRELGVEVRAISTTGDKLLRAMAGDFED